MFLTLFHPKIHPKSPSAFFPLLAEYCQSPGRTFKRPYLPQFLPELDDFCAIRSASARAFQQRVARPIWSCLQPTATKNVRRPGGGGARARGGGAARIFSRSYLSRFCSEFSVLSTVGKLLTIAFQWYLTHPIWTLLQPAVIQNNFGLSILNRIFECPTFLNS